MEWTVEKVERLKTLAGKTRAEEIARELGTSSNAVRKKAHKLGINLRVPVSHVYEMYKAGELIATGTISELAEFRGISESSVKNFTLPSYEKRHFNGKDSKRVRLVKISQ